MFVSIIIPVYNVELYLKDCLDSVLNQSFADWEAICVNDGSTDSSAAILEEYAEKDSRFKIISQPNGGLSAARNTGLKAVKGEYVLFLDSDDWLELNALEVLSKNINGEDLLCFSGRRFIEETNLYNPADVLAEKSYETGMDYYNENALLHRDFAFVCVVLRLYKRSLLRENNLRFKEGIYHEDNLFTPIVCSYARGVKQITGCLYDYRVREGSIMTERGLRNKESLVIIANELSHYFSGIMDVDLTVVYRALTHYYQVAFVNNTREEDRKLLKLMDWKAYRNVSRTKSRHKFQYLALRISPRLFRLVNAI